MHLGIDIPTQNNIFKVRRKATPLRFDFHWVLPCSVLCLCELKWSAGLDGVIEDGATESKVQ